MIVRRLIQIGNPLLHQQSRIAANIKSPKITQIIKNLIDSMRYHDLVGIAAPQIGQKERIFVTEIRKTRVRQPKDTDKMRVYINPEIEWTSKKETVIYEGCGSVAYGQLFGPVRRPANVTVSASNEKGKKFTLKADGLLARVIQHEYDHLEGVEFTEKIVNFKQIMSRGEYIKRVRIKNKMGKNTRI